MFQDYFKTDTDEGYTAYGFSSFTDEAANLSTQKKTDSRSDKSYSSDS